MLNASSAEIVVRFSKFTSKYTWIFIRCTLHIETENIIRWMQWNKFHVERLAFMLASIYWKLFIFIRNEAIAISSQACYDSERANSNQWPNWVWITFFPLILDANGECFVSVDNSKGDPVPFNYKEEYRPLCPDPKVDNDCCAGLIRRGNQCFCQTYANILRETLRGLS